MYFSDVEIRIEVDAGHAVYITAHRLNQRMTDLKLDLGDQIQQVVHRLRVVLEAGVEQVRIQEIFEVIQRTTVVDTRKVDI